MCDGSRLSCQFVVTVQPRAWSADFAAAPVADGAADAPPCMFSVPPDVPAALIDTRMLSTLVSVSAQFWKLPLKYFAKQLSNTFAGNVVRDEQFSHAYDKFVPADMFIAGNDTRDEQFSHAPLNNVTDDVFIAGNVVRDEQPYHAFEKFVPDDVSIAGNDVINE